MNRGQITITQLIGWSVALTIAAGGSFAASVRSANNKVEMVKNELSLSGQRISVVETQNVQYQKDIARLEAKIDRVVELLTTIKK